MNLSSLLFDGLKAMVLGMLWVYVFLSIMILCMKVMSKALAPFSNFLEPPPPTPKKKKESGKKAGTLSPEDRIRAQAAIEAAKRYRADHRNSASKAAYTVTVEGKTFNVQFKEGGVITADLAGQAAEGEVKKPTTASASSGNTVDINSPFPGTVTKIMVSEGDEFEAGEVIAVVEAMKMENEIKPDKAGVVREICVDLKAVVTSGQVLFKIEEK